jgi:hypothetical protein
MFWIWTHNPSLNILFEDKLLFLINCVLKFGIFQIFSEIKLFTCIEVFSSIFRLFTYININIFSSIFRQALQPFGDLRRHLVGVALAAARQTGNGWFGAKIWIRSKRFWGEIILSKYLLGWIIRSKRLWGEIIRSKCLLRWN